MPTYVYKFVETGETIEVQQAFTDDTLTEYTHPDSGDVMAVKKVFQPVGVTFKGSGFFKTDNRGSNATTPSASTDSGSSTPTKKDTDSSSKSSDSSSKPAAATSSDTSSSKPSKPSTPAT